MAKALHDTPDLLLKSITPCPACNSSAIKSLCQTDGKTGQALHTVVCQVCGLGRIDPLPQAQQLEDWYRDAYRQEYKTSFQPSMRHVIRAGRNALARWLWLQQQEGKYIGAKRTLDVGASSGEFVYLMKFLGHEAQGIEPHVGYCSYAREQLGLDIRCGSLRDECRSWPTGCLDLVTMFHVLEHVVDPLGTLMGIRKMLATDGVLYVEVPGSTRMCGPSTLFFKAHTLHFTGPTLQSVVEHAGFDVLALDAPWDGNIRLLARAKNHPDDANARSAWVFDDSIWRAAQARTPLRYLADQLSTVKSVRRIGKNIEERWLARRFSSAKACLNAIYSDVSQ